MELRRNQMKYFSSDNMRLLSSLILSLSSKQSAMENKLIDYWTPSTAYIKDESMVIYDDAIQICKISNADATFDQNKWLKLSPEITELTKDDISALINLSPEEISKLSDLISTEIRLDKVFSSSDTYMRIQAAIDTAKTYTNNQLGKAVKPAYKVVSSTSEVTETGYFYLISNGTNYDMHVLSADGSVVSLGTSDVDLTQFYDKDYVDNNFYTSAQSDGKFATIATVDGKVDKTSIATAISETPSDDKVLSEKAIYDKYKIHDLSEANDNFISNGLNIDPYNKDNISNKDGLVTQSSIQVPTNLLWGIRQVFWHSDSDIVIKVTGKDVKDMPAIWCNSLIKLDGTFQWTGWQQIATDKTAVKCLTIKQVCTSDFSGETFTVNDLVVVNGGCVFNVPLGVKTVAFDLISNGTYCQFGRCSQNGTLPAIISTGTERISFEETHASGTYYIKGISGGENIFIGGTVGNKVSNVRVVEWY